MIKQFQLLKNLIDTNQNFVITTHVNPDADAIGSALAIAEFLIAKRKNIKIINHDNTPYYLSFLDNRNLIEKYEPEQHNKIILTTDVLIVVDLNNYQRTVSMSNILQKTTAIKVCIDHHEYPEHFANHELIYPAFSSTGEIIYKIFIDHFNEELSKSIAEKIYAAIMTDTGSFRFDRTTPETHLIVAALLKAGANPQYIYEQIYEQNNFSKTKLLGVALSNIELTQSKKIAYMTITQALLNRVGSDETEVDGFVNLCLTIRGVRIGVLFFELKDGFKISLRSRGKIAVNKIAAEFGGGGHMNAAGIRLYGKNLDDYKNLVLQRLESEINK